MKGTEPGKSLLAQDQLILCHSCMNAQVCGVFLFSHLWEEHHQPISKGADLTNIIKLKLKGAPG